MPSALAATALGDAGASVEDQYKKLLVDAVNGPLELSQAATEHSFGDAFGNAVAAVKMQERLRSLARNILSAHIPPYQEHAVSCLAKWLEASNPEDRQLWGQRVLSAIAQTSDPALRALASFESHFALASSWVLVSTGASDRDVGIPDIANYLAVGSPIKLLVVVSGAEGRYGLDSKEIGLYGMMHGTAYVASIALHYSYAQAIASLKEADRFNGPALILALGEPSLSVCSQPLDTAKRVVEDGRWPLYRWNPGSTEAEPFSQDSPVINDQLQTFLDRDRQLTAMAGSVPTFSKAHDGSGMEKKARAKMDVSFKALVSGLRREPLLILFGSDGGNAEKAARKLAQDAKSRGFTPTCLPMNSTTIDNLARESRVLFILSTAGQGEFPANAKEFWKALSSTPVEEYSWTQLSFAVLGLGDSHYWPLPEDAHYFAKAGKDLYDCLVKLGTIPILDLGIADDQDPDGYHTGYDAWVQKLWTCLGTEKLGVGDSSFTPSDDAIKESSNYLRGTIAEGLADESTGALAEYDTKITKFHGIYQQDDRDVREVRLSQGLEPAFSFMVRVRVPGGVASPQQWAVMDNISSMFGNGTMKLTTRQAFQFHGILKANLKLAIQEVNRSLMDTIAACGDVNRNVMCCPLPEQSHVHHQAYSFARELSNHLTPKTRAYHEIWLDKKIIASTFDEEPLYGRTYLPRKFKVAVAVPPSNDVDVLAHDLGYIAIIENGQLAGFNVTVGGGMGSTHGNKKTYPKLAVPLGFCLVEQAVDVGEKVMLVQRDYGDRNNRKHARLKYTIEDRGLDWFKQEVEKRLGYALAPHRQFEFSSNGDRFGWHKDVYGMWHYTLYVENGRVKDTPDYRLRTGLRHVAEVLDGEFRLTPNQNLIISNVTTHQKPMITEILRQYGMLSEKHSGMRLNSLACVALPTCALAMAESERYLPSLISKLEELLEIEGLRDDAITIRMTGCPNGCARPQIAEIALVGKAPETYNLYLGGGFTGERLATLYRESVTESDILQILEPLFKRYARERSGSNEHFASSHKMTMANMSSDWDNAVSDLSRLRLTPDETKTRREIRSKYTAAYRNRQNLRDKDSAHIDRAFEMELATFERFHGQSILGTFETGGKAENTSVLNQSIQPPSATNMQTVFAAMSSFMLATEERLDRLQDGLDVLTANVQSQSKLLKDCQDALDLHTQRADSTRCQVTTATTDMERIRSRLDEVTKSIQIARTMGDIDRML